ncbi:hypothetical protein TSH58p_05045 [Azospirillum sp. TSH58]|uniref:PRC-barrel domain-containing protein n=1 Tax=Azospirillum sp. TSH58 TaxID=664962 RepID=UPI000D601516|nr:PRC-barrel domain-containing protein [Azospirillum sp. TSH58]AWJ82941.1 hypothetical protein TSH58p_05045 [Azospirillum sp. TSH58]
MRYSGTSAGILAAFAIATSLTLGVPQPVRAQPSHSAETVRTAEASYPRLYQGWRAGVIVGTEVEGLLGEELGQVVDLVVGPDGRLESAVIEASGMLDVGEARFTVPWHQLMPGSVDGILAYPVTGPDTLDLIRRQQQAASRPGDWRVSALIGQPANTAGDATEAGFFGTVEDLVFDRNGALKAVVVTPEPEGEGPYAVAWKAAALEPGLTSVTLQATPEQVKALGSFDAARMKEFNTARLNQGAQARQE